MDANRVEDLCIVGAGTFMHVIRLSFFGASDPTAVGLVPNAASTLLATTLLAALTKWRPIRGGASNMGLAQRLLRLLVELTLMACLVELLLVWLWIPMLEVVSGVCEWATERYLQKHLPQLANWLNGFAVFSFLRLLLAAGLASVIAVCRGWVQTNGAHCRNHTGREMGLGDKAALVFSRHAMSAPVSTNLFSACCSEVSSRIWNREPCRIRSVTMNESNA